MPVRATSYEAHSAMADVRYLQLLYDTCLTENVDQDTLTGYSFSAQSAIENNVNYPKVLKDLRRKASQKSSSSHSGQIVSTAISLTQVTLTTDWEAKPLRAKRTRLMERLIAKTVSLVKRKK